MKNFAKFSQASSDTVDSKDKVIALVSRLLFKRCPSYVHLPSILNTLRAFATAVVAIVVRPTINFQSIWSFSKQFKKSREHSQTHAGSDSSPGIILTGFNVGVVNASHHIAPRLISARHGSAFGVPVARASDGSSFAVQTPTRFGVSGGQITVVRNETSSTVAQTQTAMTETPWGFRNRSRFLKDDYSGKSLSNDVSFSRHNGAWFTVLFSGRAFGLDLRMPAAILSFLFLWSSTASASMLWYQDHEARLWYTTSGSTVSGNTKVAATRWMLQMRAAGLRKTIVRANLNAGANLTTALVPIVKDFGDATDPKHGTDPAYTEATGLTVSGLNNMETGFNPTNLVTDAAGLSIYLGGANGYDGSSIPIGAAAFGGNDFYILGAFTNVGPAANIYATAGRPIVTNSVGVGFFSGSRISAATNGVSIYRDGNLLARSTSVSGSPPNTAGSAGGVYYGGVNNAGSAAFITLKDVRGYEINRGRTDAQSGSSYRIWQRFQTTLGRHEPQ